jgi:hypothetical protein
VSTKLTVPGSIVWRGESPVIAFGTLGSDLMDQPFLDQQLAGMRITALRPLDQIEVEDDGGDLGLAGAVFHMSRCGSTLLCRQFDALEGVAALSEPFVFQQLLDGPPAAPALTRVRLRKLVALWREAVAPVADRFIIKWPLGVGHHAATVAGALPKTPMIFLHREPVEVLASIERDSLGGLRHVRPHHAYGQPDPQAEPRSRTRICAEAIATACLAIAPAPGVRSLDYRLLPGVTAAFVAPLFGLTPDARMVAAAADNSKVQGRAFVPDATEKQAVAGQEVRELARTVIAPALAVALGALDPVPASDGQDGDGHRAPIH